MAGSRAASAVAGSLPPGCLLARIGGDEFGVLVRQRRADMDLLAKRIRRAIENRVVADGHRLSASIGWSGSPPARSVEQALLEADAHLYEQQAHRRVARLNGETTRSSAAR